MHNIFNMPYTIQSPTFENLPMKDLFNAKKVSKTASLNVEEYCRSRFNVDSFYSTFFPKEEHCKEFKNKLEEAGALASSFALIHILSRQSPKPATLYLYTPTGYVYSLGEFLSERKFTFEPLPEKRIDKDMISAQATSFKEALLIEHQKPIPNTGKLSEMCDDSTVASVFYFRKGDLEICIVGTRNEPMEVILSFHTTKQIVSLYPKTSFVQRRALILKKLSDTTESVLRSFEAEGWSTFKTTPAIQYITFTDELSYQTRWVGDDHCWITDQRYTDPSHNRYRSLWVTSWHLTCPDIDHTELTCQRLEHSALTNRYPLTWETERAIWAHPCFFDIDPDRIITDTDEVEDFEDTCSETSERHDDLAPRKHRCGHGPNQRPVPIGKSLSLSSNKLHPSLAASRTIHDHSDIEPALIEYLRDFYPLMRQANRMNHIMRSIRSELDQVQNTFGTSHEYIVYPTSHALAIVLQTIEDVKRCRGYRAVKFTLNFTLNTATNTVTTTCTIRVPEPEAEKIETDLSLVSTWSEDHTMQAGVVIKILAEEDTSV
ncbi:hypothetical protein VNI00_005516 [Paramarasmius palmivorus]|uniref:Uncharacterized protein n=1 Tax=Paramarasmius palmivorus TaxID=297713 RepID=A0AAW0DE27_9AGAR